MTLLRNSENVHQIFALKLKKKKRERTIYESIELQTLYNLQQRTHCHIKKMRFKS